MQIVIATKNSHKARELSKYFSNAKHCDFFSLMNFPKYVVPEETGTTFEQNAILKARHAAQTLRMWALADDSGLVVPALDGAPGIFSARYAGEGSTDKENRERLLKEMSHLHGEERSAYFVCVLALARPDGAIVFKTSGLCEGFIVEKERGGGGFGYDSLFTKYDYRQTFAEISEEIKNRISHRAKAASKLALYLERL